MTIHGNAVLALEDGRLFHGEPLGAPVEAGGEVVFTTCMTGYQEVATDPSFDGQLVTFTYPLIGNYGVTPEDDESWRPWVAGLVMREYSDEPSNWRSVGTLDDYLHRHRIPAIVGVDTRALTRHLRDRGLLRGVLVPDRRGLSDAELVARARRAPLPSERNVVAETSIPEIRTTGDPRGRHVVLLDCGHKQNIVRSLERRGLKVTVVPWDTPFETIAALGPDGVTTSPGPGDPENVAPAVETVRRVVDAGIPFMGICLGHQLLALAIGAETSRLHYGHRGGNQPVKDLRTGRVHITSQNHGFKVDPEQVPTADGWRVGKINLNDGSVEGLDHATRPVFSVQYHPEGAPGPQDNQYLFDRFIATIAAARAVEEEATAAGGVAGA
ncbi:MAG TPA: glutamine-hydrolyzing carbamoyl-phosphate synthase small subunit [Thermomicrobiales bacterium]|nr:glutamine-hydrolyzing carbamoyl-phosphate synthase small subunit [Thermomicrobiales bacterium]